MKSYGNSIGNTNKDVRKFLRESGVKPTVANVERIQREVVRTQSENERVERVHREMERERGVPSTRDERGDIHARVKAQVRKDLERRQR